MSDFYITSHHIKKLGHPIKEIRERALESLFSKLEYGFQLDDQLNRSKELLIFSLKWFEFDHTSHQDKVIKLISYVIKSPSGRVVIQHLGSKILLQDLYNIKNKITQENIKHFEDVIQLITSLNISVEESNSTIPHLGLPHSIESLMIERDFTNNPASTVDQLRESLDDIQPTSVHPYTILNGVETFDLSKQGIKIYLLPWCHLCEIDLETLRMIEDAICIEHSTERTVRFFTDILLKDFPCELFLNRPTIIQNLYKLLNDSKMNILSLEALNALSVAINLRINQLMDPDMRRCKKSSYERDNSHIGEQRNKTEQYSISMRDISGPEIDFGSASNQIPLPIFCLETIYNIMNCLGQSVPQTLLTDKNEKLFGMEQMNVALKLCFECVKILDEIITSKIWQQEQSNKFIQQISQKIVIMLRSLGDILNRYRILSLTNEVIDSVYRITYIRLLAFGVTLAKWLDYTPLIPTTFISSLFDSMFDASCLLLFPKLHNDLKNFVQSLIYRSIKDEEKFELYLDCEKINSAMSISVNFLQNYDSISNSTGVIKIIKDSMPTLEFHQNSNYIGHVMDIFCTKLPKWRLDNGHIGDIRFITLTLLAHSQEWIQETFYSSVHIVVSKVLGGTVKTKNNFHQLDENSLKFLLHSSIMIEISNHGVDAKSRKVQFLAKEIIQFLLRGKLLMSDSSWGLLLEALLPALPYIHVHAAHDDVFGQSILKTLDLNIGQRMLIPTIDMIMGNVRLLHTKCFTAQMEGSLNLIKFLNLQDGSDNLLPKYDCIKPDVLCSILRCVNPSNFNIIKHGDPSFYEKGSLLQVMTLLKNQKSLSYKESEIDHRAGGDSMDVDPSFRRSALAQLAVMLQQPTLHEVFLSNSGCKIIVHYLKASLKVDEYSCFPETALSCVSILNSLCYSNASIRQWASEQQELVLNTIRVLFLFPNEDNFSTIASQLLCLFAFAQVMNNVCDVDIQNEDISSDLSLPQNIIKNTNLPFKCHSYSQSSPHRRADKRDILMSDLSISSFIRINWCSLWYGDVDKVVRWPYVPDISVEESFSPSLILSNTDLAVLKASCPIQGCVLSHYQVQNATSHKAVNGALDNLNGYLLLTCDTERGMKDFDSLPWRGTFSRFINVTPASPKDSSLLLNIVKCLSIYLETLIKNESADMFSVHWIFGSVIDTPSGITSLLKHTENDSNWMENNCDQTPSRLRQSITEMICSCCLFYYDFVECGSINISEKMYADFGALTDYITDCLCEMDISNYYSLAYVSQVVKCLCHLTFFKSQDSFTKRLSVLIKNLAQILTVSYIGDDYNGYKGLALIQNSFEVLCQLLETSLLDKDKMKFWLENCLDRWGDENVLKACLLWHDSSHLIVKSLSFKLLTGLSTQPTIVAYLNEKFEESDNNFMETVIDRVVDLNEASIFREQAAVFLSNLLSSKSMRNFEIGSLNSDFYDKITATVKKICLNESEELETGGNIPLEILSNREVLEVANSKNEFSVEIKLVNNSSPKCSVKLLTTITDVLFNILLYVDKVPGEIVNSGILRFLFRCISLNIKNEEAKLVMIAAICRVLHKAVNMSLEIHSTIVNTEDCVSALLNVFSSEYAVLRSDKKLVASLQEMWKWAFFLVGSLVETKIGFNCLWRVLSESGMLSFFHILLISIGDKDCRGDLSSSLFCLVNLLSASILYPQENNSLNIQSVLDETLTSDLNLNNNLHDAEDTFQDSLSINNTVQNKTKGYKNVTPVSTHTTLSEDLCGAMLNLHKTLSKRKNNILSNVEENYYHSVISGLCGLFATSVKAKIYAVRKGFIQDQIEFLQEMQYTITNDIKALDVIHRKENHPVLRKLNWSIELLCNIMINFQSAKDECANCNLVVPLNKMWPWCICTIEIRSHTIQMLCAFTNDCQKANQSMHMTVGVRSLLTEILDLVGKEMNLVTRKHSLSTLRGCLQILENVSSHVHCRAVILKSEILGNLNKLHPAITKRQPQWREIETMWESFCITISRYPEGQLKVAESLGVLCALVHQADGLMLPVLRNCAFNTMNRPRLLASAELLNLFSIVLTSNSPVPDKLTVCGALWALAANHHKSKLSLRTSGLTAKLSDSLHRLKYTSSGDSQTDRAIQIMTYVMKVISIV